MSIKEYKNGINENKNGTRAMKAAKKLKMMFLLR